MSKADSGGTRSCAHMFDTTVSEFIGHFISLVTRVPFDPTPFYLVT
jgi:hypothetical protein